MIAEASTSAILIPAVKNGLAATILPYSAAHEEIHDGTIAMRRFDFEFFREIFICHTNNSMRNDAVDCVMDECEKTAASLIAKNAWKYTRLL
ncbi:LysR family transcriptional regulator [Advenella kashmirensis WT001]|uniref:LysR family transcriptional regulator n=1 Tax=Advenella kashmirensis (strain DSM 17095 / LMG 22695 / WT001) TaxID=1036672 RepID=I3U967_ADVKW|nr:LysR family transcriptional regulator [Advenella kashmirensis WT001]